MTYLTISQLIIKSRRVSTVERSYLKNIKILKLNKNKIFIITFPLISMLILILEPFNKSNTYFKVGILKFLSS